MAISPDVVSSVHCRFGYCDLLRRSGIRNVAGETSFVSLATGTARNAVYCTPSRKAEALAPVPPSPWPAVSSVLCCLVVSSLPKRRPLS